MSRQVVFGLNIYGNREYDLTVYGSDRIHDFRGALPKEPNTLGILRLGLLLLCGFGDVIEDLDNIIALMEAKQG